MSHYLGSSGAHNSVAERRLRPIHDWLNVGNNRKALQECDRILKKSANFSCCKVLKSLALIRMGRREDALSLLEMVLSEGPTDEETLQAMAIAYRESLQLDKICHMYEKAIAKEPNNEDLLSHLFMSYVRIGDYKKQQQAAFALYKAAPKNPYYFWAIMSILLYATLGKDDNNTTQFSFSLAQRMMIKMEKENKMKQEQETHLYLMVLEAQDKHKEALDILEGPLGIKLDQETSYLNFVAFKKIELLKKMERWSDVCRRSRESLIENPDQWCLYLDYISSIFKLMDESREERVTSDSSQSNGVNTEASISEANVFLIDQQTKNESCRGPYLAQIDLIHRQISRGDEPVCPIADLLMQYIKLFGNKAMCFSDIRLYLEKLNPSDLKKIAASDELIELDDKGFPKSVNDVSRHLLIYQVRRFTREYQGLSEDDSMKVVQELLTHYAGVYHLVSAYGNTELRPSDMYIVLASHFLWDLWIDTRKDRFLNLAIRILESTLERSPVNFHLRFLLIKFYNKAGAVSCSIRIHEGLGLKHIQLDSLGYVISRHVISCGYFIDAEGIYKNTIKFFTRNHKDTVDHIISAYRCGSFDKIREFIKLRDRLSNSLHGATLKVESHFFDLLKYVPSDMRYGSRWESSAFNDDIPWDDLHDNRDFRVMVSYDPIDKSVTESLIQDNFKDEKKYLKFRSLIERSLAISLILSGDIQPDKSLINSCSDPKNGCIENKENNGGPSLNEKFLVYLESILNEVKSILESHDPTSPPEQTFSILQGPDPSRMASYLPYAKCKVHCIELVLAVHKQGGEESKLIALSSITKNYSSLVNRIKNLMASKKQLIDAETIFQVFTYTLEATSMIAAIGGSICTLLKPSMSKKIKKKKGLSQGQEKFSIAFNEMGKSLLSSLEEVQALIADYESILNNQVNTLPEEPDVFSAFESLESFDVEGPFISEVLKDSYSGSFQKFLCQFGIKESLIDMMSLEGSSPPKSHH